MEYLIGALIAVVFFLCLLLVFWLGTQYAKKKPPDKVKVDEETVRLQAKIHDDFIKTMSYDVTQATARKKVT